MPRFSVVVPAYNATDTLAETLDAVIQQQYRDWECIVVDDGSQDDTLDIASAFAARDSRIRVLSQKNMGTAGAYNTGVSDAAGALVVVCSADDILLPSHMLEMDALISAEADYGIYSCNGYYWRPQDQSRELVYRPGELGVSLTLAEVIRNCFFGVGTMYRREVFHSVGGYRVGVFGEDYDFWMRAMAHGARHRYLDRPLALHRIGPSQKTADLDRVYASDIRLVRELARDFELSAEELAAVKETISRREILMKRARESGLRRRLRDMVTSQSLHGAGIPPLRMIQHLRAWATRGRSH